MIGAALALIPGVGPIFAALGTPLGRLAAVALLVLGSYSTGHIIGRRDERAKAREATLRNELAIARIDIAIQKTNAEALARDAASAAALAAKNEEAIRAYEKELAARPASAACRADRRDVALDRKLRGSARR